MSIMATEGWLTLTDQRSHLFEDKFEGSSSWLVSLCGITISGQHAYTYVKDTLPCRDCLNISAIEYLKFNDGRKMRNKLDDAEKLELFRIAEGKTTAELVEWFSVRGKVIAPTLTQAGFISVLPPGTKAKDESATVKVWTKKETKEDTNMGVKDRSKNTAPKNKVEDESHDDLGIEDPDLSDVDLGDDDEEETPKPKAGKGKSSQQAAEKKNGKSKPKEDDDEDDLGNLDIDEVDMDDVPSGGIDLDEASLGNRGGKSVNFDLVLIERLDGFKEAILGHVEGLFKKLLKGVEAVEGKLSSLRSIDGSLVALKDSIEYLKAGLEDMSSEPAEEAPPKKETKSPTAALAAGKTKGIPAPFTDAHVQWAFRTINKQASPVGFARLATALANSDKTPEGVKGPDVEKLLVHMGYRQGDSVTPETISYEQYQKALKK